MTTRTRPAALAVAVLALAGLTACSSALTGNDGGDTTCGAYMVLPPEEQREVITTFLDEKSVKDPVGGDVTHRQEATKLYCSTTARDTDPIRNADTG